MGWAPFCIHGGGLASLGHPYPAGIEPYIVLGGIFIYVVGGLCVVAFVRSIFKVGRYQKIHLGLDQAVVPVPALTHMCPNYSSGPLQVQMS